MRENVKILLMGDDGVGKSSLLSTYISRHFPQEVPPVVSDTILPPETTADRACVTIMDSSSHLNDREILRNKILIADCIILLHDVTRPETLENIVRIWIPLIKEVQQQSLGGVTIGPSPVATVLSSSQASISNNVPPLAAPTPLHKPLILLGTKIDLVNEEDLSDQTITEIFTENPDLLFCSWCSSSRLQHIDSLFYIAESIVTHPIRPLYDVMEKEFTPLGYQAFQRIFRILDLDGDNLLNDLEMMYLQVNCFEYALDATDIANMKRNVYERNPEGVTMDQQGFTFLGFLEVLKMAMERHQFQTPWVILRYYHYDDDLNIQIPKEISSLPKLKGEQSYQLSDHAIKFLLNIAKNAYDENTRPIRSAGDSDSTSEVEDCLTTEALKSIFAILPKEFHNHPWSKPPSYQSLWPYQTTASSSTQSNSGNLSSPSSADPIEQCILLNRFPHDNAILSFDAWLIQWNILAFTEPILVQKLLFLLGYVDRLDFGVTVQTGNIYTLYKHRLQQSQSTLSQYLPFLKKTSFLSSRSLLSLNGRDLIAPRGGGAGNSHKGLSEMNQQRFRPKRMLNIAVLGDNDVGKSSFAWYLSGLRIPGRNNPFFLEEEIVEKSFEYEKPYESIVIGGSLFSMEDSPNTTSLANPPLGIEIGSSPNTTHNGPVMKVGQSPPSTPPSKTNSNGESQHDYDDANTVYFSISSVPMEHVRIWAEKCIHQYDLIVFMFSCDNRDSVQTVLNLDKGLPPTIPRLHFCSKMDLLRSPSDNQLQQVYESSLEMMNLHLQEHDLLPVVNMSTLTGEGIIEAVKQIKLVYQQPELGIKAAIKRQKTMTERLWHFLCHPLTIFSSGSSSDFLISGESQVSTFIMPVTALFAVASFVTASYFLIRYDSTLNAFYQRFTNEVFRYIGDPLEVMKLPLFRSRSQGTTGNKHNNTSHPSNQRSWSLEGWVDYLSPTFTAGTKPKD